MNTKLNSNQLWHMDCFKKAVRAIHSELLAYPYYAAIEREEFLDDHEIKLLQSIIREFKEFCVFHFRYFTKISDFSRWQELLDFYMKHFLNVRIIWVEGSQWTDPDWEFNSLIIDFYKFPNEELAF